MSEIAKKNKRTWSTPTLTVLTRAENEEFVLQSCKHPQASRGPRAARCKARLGGNCKQNVRS